ncbi:unnamed protein product [Durusdinium trenchii]|uniref:Selenoprotein O n=1 Tax=Durusdinium trenchii TaxID=1381693 RepID=A0ABP0LM76_9DINO
MGVSKDQTDHLTRMDKRPLEEGADSAGHEEVLHLQVDQTNGAPADWNIGDAWKLLEHPKVEPVPPVLPDAGSKLPSVRMAATRDSMPWCTRIRSRLEWGKGLGPIVRAIEEELQEMKDFNSRNGNPDRKILVLVPWAENDVYGDYGYAGCKWINQKRYLKTEADRKVAAEWPFAQLTRVREAVEKIIELRNQPEVADLVMIGNAPAEDYDLPKAYNRYLCEHYAYMISRGVMSYKEEIEPLTILNAGEGEGDLQLMEFFIRYPPISEVRATADVMLARRRAAEEVELNPADIVDSVEQEIMNWLQQEEEADQLRTTDDCQMRPKAEADHEDLSCEGYHFDGVDWGSLRRRFEIYADKYLDRPQLLAEEFDLAKSYAFSYSPENRCLLGDLTLRFFLWLAVSPSELRAAVAALSSDGAAASTLTELMQETWTWFWDLPLSWEEILKSGWPLFSILAAVSERVRDEGDRRCESPELAPFVETFDNAIAVSTHHAASLLLEARADCPEATASALVALADQLRTTMWQQPNRYYHFTSTLPERQPKEEDVEILLSRAEALLRPARSWRSLTQLWQLAHRGNL